MASFLDHADPHPPAVVALDDLDLALASLVKLVEDGGLAGLDPLRLVEFAQGFERVRNRLALVDHQIVQQADRCWAADQLMARNTATLLATTLRLSAGEARRRVKAAEAVAPRTSMLGERLDPVRP